MSIKTLLLEMVLILATITCAVIALSSFQIHRDTATHIIALQQQYFDATAEIYQNNIIGDLLIGENRMTTALLQEIAHHRKLGISVNYQNHELQGGEVSATKTGKQYPLDLGNGKKAMLTIYPGSNLIAPSFFKNLGATIFFEALVFALGFLYLSRLFKKRLLDPLTDLVSHLKPGDLETYQMEATTVVELKELTTTLKKMHDVVQKEAVYEAESNAAKEVAHDIRSPLATLHRLLDNVKQLPEKERVLLTNAIHRIQDISNNLLSKHQPFLHIDSSSLQAELVSELLNSVVSEKHIQYEEKQIDFRLIISEGAHCLFAIVNAVNFKQVISNLIDNAVEAIHHSQGKLTIELTSVSNGHLRLVVEDNGCGIAPHLIPEYLKGGATSKKDGHGMGLSTSMKMVERWGGTLEIESIEKEGTKIIVSIPQSEVADWFANQMTIKQNSTVIILDDDNPIHQVWDLYFEEKKLFSDIQVMHFYDPFSLINFYNEHQNHPLFFLIDFNLLNNRWDGLDLIEHLNIADRSILVTNQYDDESVRSRAEQLSLKILPKNHTSHIGISLLSQNTDYVLLDDDVSVRDLWELAAEQSKKQLVTFEHCEQCKAYLLNCHKETAIYVDSKLQGALRGELFAKELFDLGYQNIYLCTGYPASHFQHVDWVKGVVGKEPPF